MLHLLRNFIFRRGKQIQKRQGCKCLAQLPEGWDDQTRLMPAPGGGILAIHPEKKPLHISENGEVTEIDFTFRQ